MSKIVRLRKSLIHPPAPTVVPGVTIRPFAGAADVEPWLALRTGAMAGLTAGGRPWTAADMAREFAASRLWVAAIDDGGIVGAVALGRAGRPPHDRPVLQWLLVASDFRRRGIGAALVAVVERAAWDDGERELTLETHADWRDAARLYERRGYEAT